MSPRPILKQPSSSSHPQHHAVHFPPSPSLTRTFSAHSSTTYDRSPIVVSKNSCALPERGCPGRNYNIDDPSYYRPAFTNACDYHPRALAFASHRPDPSLSNLPPLIPDMSSESEESDSFLPSPGPYSYANTNPYSYSVHGLPRQKYDYTLTCDGPSDMYACSSPQSAGSAPSISPHALSFLPYSPTSPVSPSYTGMDDGYTSHHASSKSPSSKRRRGERERKHESSRDPDRIRSGVEDGQVTPRRSTFGRKKDSSSKTGGLCASFSAFGLNDDGCLGGF